MSQALYREWRPQRWDEVVGQDHVVQTLRNAIRSNHVAHAYLFAGPRGTGKTTTARLLAKAVNCTDDHLDERPCDRCEACLAVNEGRFMDLIEIDAASNTSVDDVRDLREKINFSPSLGRYKVYIIDEVHMLSTAAFNALLKTLEEPPDHAIFVLATTEVHKVPATVLSRCQRHEFRRIPSATIVDYLQQKIESEALEIEEGVLSLIARMATGSLRDAISLLDQLTSSQQKVTLQEAQLVLGTVDFEAVRQLMDHLIEHDGGAGVKRIDATLDAGADPRQLARQIVDYARAVLLIKLGSHDLVEATPDQKAVMSDQASVLSTDEIVTIIETFDAAGHQQAGSWLPSLPLEMAVASVVLSQGSAHVKPAGNSISESSPEVKTPPTTTSNPDVEKPKSSSSEKSAGSDGGTRETPPASSGDASPPAEPEPPPPPDQISFHIVIERWQQILQSAYNENPRTQALLKSGKPLGLEDDILVLGFASDLLCEKMEKRENKDVVVHALEQTLAKPLGVRCVLSSSWTDAPVEDAPPMEDDGMVATAIKDFGAQVVKHSDVPPDEPS